MKHWQKEYHDAGYRCVYCYHSLHESLRIWHSSTSDHIYPRSKKRGGINHRINRVACCQLCNSLKGDFIPDLAKLPGVVVTMAGGKKYIAPEWREFYMQDIRDHIEVKRKRRDSEYNAEITRIS